jgi:RNA ligase (TIGR02306 family)
MSSLIVPVVRISSLEKHPNADTLEIAKFEGFGWQSITKIGQYTVGDVVIFVPPDCILPDWIIDAEQIGYLKDHNGRTRTVRLRKELSEGIVLPLDLLYRAGGGHFTAVGTNVAENLGITKYEPPAPKYQQTGPKAKKDRPYNSKAFPKYTDIENIKNYWSIVETLLGVLVQITEKIHGTNFRAGWVLKERLTLMDRIKKLFGKFDPWVFTCGSRNVEMGIDKDHSTYYEGLGENIYQKFGRKMKNIIPKGYIVYGEIYGQGIQDLTYGIDGLDFVIFDVMDSPTQKYMDFAWARQFVYDWFGDDVWAPVEYIGPLTPEAIGYATSGYSTLAMNHGVTQMREGCVIKPIMEMTDPVLGRVVFKSINPEYLTRKKGTEFK